MFDSWIHSIIIAEARDREEVIQERSVEDSLCLVTWIGVHTQETQWDLEILNQKEHCQLGLKGEKQD